jgi:hypothetical protein
MSRKKLIDGASPLTEKEIKLRDAWVAQSPVESLEAREALANLTIYAYRHMLRLSGDFSKVENRRSLAAQQKAVRDGLSMLGVCLKTRDLVDPTNF